MNSRANRKNRCDLLKNIYLCGSNNNYMIHRTPSTTVVICLKISIFVVATTTAKGTRTILIEL